MKVVVPGLGAGIVGTIVTDQVIKGSTDLTNKLMLLSVSCLVLVFISIFFTVLNLISIVESRNTFSVSVSRDETLGDFKSGKRASGRPKDQDAFQYCTYIAKRACKSIYVVGPHFPDGKRPKSEEHGAFLEAAMSESLERLSEYDPERAMEGRQFRYLRVVQYDRMSSPAEIEQGVLEEAAVGDPDLTAHLKRAIALGNKTDGAVDVQLWARPYVPSLPSILVVDETYIFFSLPTYTAESENAPPELEYNFVFEIEDRVGNVARHFIRMITQLTGRSAHPIREIRTSATDPPSI